MREPLYAAPPQGHKPLAMLLADLGVTKTHSRPRVSNDNPYSESQFKWINRPQPLLEAGAEPPLGV